MTSRPTFVAAAKDGEKVIFTWQIRANKASFRAAEEQMHQDARMDTAGEPPFDARRLILGCFESIFSMGRGQPPWPEGARDWPRR